MDQYWYLSFSKNKVWIGGCYLKANTLNDAINLATQLNIANDSTVVGKLVTVTETPPIEWHNKLITPQQYEILNTQFIKHITAEDPKLKYAGYIEEQVDRYPDGFVVQ